MKIKFWGCRGSIPVPDSRMIEYGGNTSCIEVTKEDKTLIIDAGTGIRKLGEKLINNNINDVDVIITHSHWDHIQGFPFFTPIYRKESNINMYGCKHSYKQIRDILTKQMSYEFFPVRFSDLKSTINFVELCEDSGVENDFIKATIQTNHPIFTLGMRIENNGKSFVFITDNELMSDTPNTSWQKFVDFCKGATYLIHDAQFTDEEYQKSKGWGHSSYEQVIKLAEESRVENLGFFHHDPNRKDDELNRIEAKYSQLCKDSNCNFNVFAVKESDEIEI